MQLNILRTSSIALIFISLLFIGCTTFNLKEFDELRKELPYSQIKACQAAAGGVSYKSGLSSGSFLIGSELTPLMGTKAMSAAVSTYDQVINRSPSASAGLARNTTPSSPNIEITASDLEDFGKIYAKTILDPSTYIRDNGNAQQGGAVKERTLQNVFKEYYNSYIEGNFVDRFGTKFSKPEIKKSITNDIISASLLVFLEAVADTKLNTPIIKSGNTYYPSGGTVKPTALVVSLDGKTIVPEISAINDPTACGITEKEAKAIMFLSNLSGDKSALVSKLVVEAFGGAELSFVIGGHFSVGDNKTLSTVVSTFLESMFRRGTERIAYEFFHDFSYGVSPGGGAPAISLTGKMKTIEEFITKL